MIKELANIAVRIQEFKDRVTPLWPELNGKKAKHALATKASVLEKGTVRGNSTVQLIAETEDGEILVIETTTKLLNAVAKIASGAALRWGDTEI